ncbi:hypothetical protein AMR72_17585 [Flavobacterium psychrophilum]|nr:hypothetical protein AMR72_17585 [Flavobacterium psychrophilum]AOE54155.1 hypothetical protein ALW18_17570 [Flavobacterium psychrophilum]
MKNSRLRIKDKLGLRIKSIADFSQSGSLGNYKRYYYNSYLNRLNSIDSQLNYKIPQYVSDEVEEIPCSIGTVGGAPCDPTIARDKVISSSSLNSIYAPGGSKYQYVTISYGGDNFENGGKEITFSVAEDSKIIEVFGPGSPTFFWNMLEFGKYSNTGLTNGTILEENYFKVASNNYAILQKKQYNYKEIPEKSGYLTNCFISKLFKRNACPSESNSGDNALEIGERNGQRFYMNYNIRNYYFGVYYTYYKWYNLDKVTTTDYFAAGNIVTSEELFYDSKLAGLPSRKEVAGTNGITSTKYYYPHDLPTEFLMQDLIQANRYEQIRTESFVNNVKTFETKTAYAKDATTGNIARPKFEYAAKFPNSNPNLFTIGQLEKRATYDLYDPKGNILQFTQEGGISTSVIYGYNRMHPLAIIKNATFSEVLSALGTTEASLQTLIVAPSTIRTVLPSSLITTYNYKPLIGVSMITDEKGIKTYYNYDTDGRLKDVRDNQNYILSENDYKIKN